MSINFVRFKNSKLEGRMIIMAPYNAYFVDGIKKLGVDARWNAEKKFWGFDANGFDKVEALVIDAYGDPTPRTGSKNEGRLTITYADGQQKHFNYVPDADVYSGRLERIEAERQTGGQNYY